MDCNLKIVFWNMRGLNSRARRMEVRSLISSVSPSIVYLSETKLAVVDSSIVTDTLRPLFDRFLFLPTSGTRGGILMA